MATKQDKDTPPAGSLEAARRSIMHRRRPMPPAFRNPRAERAWHEEQQRLDREHDLAWRTCPPGTRMFVTTARGISTRGRAGLRFSAQGRTEVEVVALDEGQLELARKLARTDERLLERLRRGDQVDGLEGVDVELLARALSAPSVTPVGGYAIKRDDGLLVLDDAGGRAREELAAKDNAIAERDAEILRLREQLAAARGGGAARSGEGRPERLARDKAPPASSEAFGGDDAGKAKG